MGFINVQSDADSVKFFGIGHCGVIGMAGTSSGLVQRYLNWNAQSRGLVVMKGTCGVLLLFSASYLVYTA